MNKVAVTILIMLVIGLVAEQSSLAEGAASEALESYNYGDFDAAKTGFQQALTGQPENCYLTYMLANTCSALGQHLEAIALYKKARQLKPDAETAFNIDDALRRYEEIAKLRAQVAVGSKNVAASSAAIDRQASELTRKYNLQEELISNSIRQGAARESARIKAICDAEIASLRASGRSTGRSRSYRSGYSSASSSYSYDGASSDPATLELQQDAARRQRNLQYATDDVIRKYEEEKAQMNKRVSDSARNLQSQMASPKGTVQLNPDGTNLYVRSYVVKSQPLTDALKATPAFPVHGEKTRPAAK